jgi:hypothetical protein
MLVRRALSISLWLLGLLAPITARAQLEGGRAYRVQQVYAVKRSLHGYLISQAISWLAQSASRLVEPSEISKPSAGRS